MLNKSTIKKLKEIEQSYRYFISWYGDMYDGISMLHDKAHENLSWLRDFIESQTPEELDE